MNQYRNYNYLLLLRKIITMNPFMFRATTNSRKFQLQNLHNCVSNYANIRKIVYYPNFDNDYAYIFVKDWREHSKCFIENIYFHKQAFIDINKRGHYWKFTPIENDPNNGNYLDPLIENNLYRINILDHM